MLFLYEIATPVLSRAKESHPPSNDTKLRLLHVVRNDAFAFNIGSQDVSQLLSNRFLMKLSGSIFERDERLAFEQAGWGGWMG